VNMAKLVTKLIVNSVVLVPLLWYLAGASFLGSLVTSLGLAVIAYIIGDQLILRRSNNLIATIADAGLAFVYLWMVRNFTDWPLSFTEILTIVAALGIVEWFFHAYLQRQDGKATT